VMEKIWCDGKDTHEESRQEERNGDPVARHLFVDIRIKCESQHVARRRIGRIYRQTFGVRKNSPSVNGPLITSILDIK
jgi:hypothetical protein